MPDRVKIKLINRNNNYPLVLAFDFEFTGLYPADYQQHAFQSAEGRLGCELWSRKMCTFLRALLLMTEKLLEYEY